jgi:hypothetical protein
LAPSLSNHSINEVYAAKNRLKGGGGGGEEAITVDRTLAGHCQEVINDQLLSPGESEG